MSVLGALVGLLMPSPLGVVKAAARPRPYGTAIPDQVAIAAAQAPQGMLRGGLSNLTGSEADYADEQASGNPNLGAPLTRITNGLTKSVPQPVSWYQPNLPGDLIEGRGTGPQTGAYNKGWVILRRAPWGATTRDRAPNVITSTLLSPRDRAPLPADMATTYQAQNKGRTRLEDMFGD